jgi:hypothetical protein
VGTGPTSFNQTIAAIDAVQIGSINSFQTTESTEHTEFCSRPVFRVFGLFGGYHKSLHALLPSGVIKKADHPNG